MKGFRDKAGALRFMQVFAVTGAMGLILAGCGGAPSTSSQTSSASKTTLHTPSKKPYVINAILSETGVVAFLGQPEKKALLALQRQVNASGGIDGTPIKFNIQDNQSNPTESVSLASPLIAQGSPVLIVGSYVAAIAPVDHLATSRGPVIWALSPGIYPQPDSFVFSTGASTLEMTTALVTWCKAKGWTKIAALTSTDGTGQDGWTQLQVAVKSVGGVQVVDHEDFNPNALSVSTPLDRIAASHPQAVVIWATGSPAETVLKDLKQSSLANLPVISTDGNQTYAQMKQWASFLPPNLYFPSPRFVVASRLTGKAAQVTNEFLTAFGNVKPDKGEALAWDPALITIQALREDGTHATAQQLRDTIANMKGFEGVDGTYNFSSADHNGLSVDDLYMTKWDPAQNTWVPASGPGGRLLPQ